jgi:sulfotransferase famil protein
MNGSRLIDTMLIPVDGLHDRLEQRRSLHGDADRVYCFHVRKTGGTSLYRSVMGLGGEDPAVVHARIATSRRNRTRTGDLVLQANRRRELERGQYSYGWAHTPAHSIRLPPRTFTVSVLRDPVDRVVSHYRMLRDDNPERYPVPPPQKELAWTEHGWLSFLRRIPDQHLFRQLYMFSASGDVAEAADRILECSLVFRLEQMDSGLKVLGQLLGQALQPRWERRSAPTPDVDNPIVRTQLRELLDPEYRLLEQVGLESSDGFMRNL